MTIEDPSKKVIPLPRRGSGSGDDDAQRRRKPRARVIAITSGKGGVGKTNIVANLGYALSRLGQKVLILDADLGLGNLDVLLGIAPKFNVSHVIRGEKAIADILEEGPGDMKILPAASGIQDLTQLTHDQKMQFFTDLDRLIDDMDILLIDTAAGISSNVMDFNVMAHEIIVVVSPEPTSITDAYALMKVLSLKYAEKSCKLLVNMVSSPREAQEVFRQLDLVTERFLEIDVDYLGCVLRDDKLTRGVKHQRLVSDLYPESKASRCFADLARRIAKVSPASRPKGNTNLFWHHLVRNSPTRLG
jgi:flagellar biosynthesis protein FlhG